MVELGSERTREVAALFDVVADSYDAVGVAFFQPIAASLLRAMPPRAGERWLDVGCGRGAVLLMVAAALGGDGLVAGTDLSEKMLAHCRRLARENDLGHVELVRDDAQAPAVGGGPYDTLSASLVLFFLPDPGSALRAWLPLVSPGGRIGVTTFGPVDPRWTRVSDVFASYLPPHLLDARTTGIRGPFASDTGVEELLTGAGWTDVRTVTDDVQVRFSTPQQWEAFSMATGQRGMWMSVPQARREAVRAEAYRRLAADASSDGSVVYFQGIRHTLGQRPA